MKTTPFPLKFHSPRCGYATAFSHQEFCDQNPDTSRPVDTSNEYNLVAGDDFQEPLHFWQLYSVIGEEPIHQIVTDFYTRVFDDHDDPSFRDVFTRLAPLNHHIKVQVAYWIDAMGGGRRYPGGEYRLNFHHQHNAQQVMTAQGAKRWMYHMRGALETIKFEDPRVKPCILEFLTTKMCSYAQKFGWEFDEKDMELYQD
ncbi:Bacterial-like globin [Seminavis robusta]|uniref:Bacterial-like globin n=1 Tax=Seminavis robusta TaxID=568900 RepID=A0A9N8DZF6_9STRA|nr:Bacterial-like globin [Seminavis robusta]|eukprot:Sro469_g149340.1 Bacterial-like globin (199) ;mRNA; r:38688-39284